MSRFFAAVIGSFAVLILGGFSASDSSKVAPTPPMGWNSWDAYGFTIDEAQFRDNVSALARMKDYGWQYAVIDEGWYMQNPLGANTAEQKYLYDKNGLLQPVPSRYPSAENGAGFKPLADWVHAQGMKFGIHILRGIPRQVVDENLPIEGTSFHAADAADKQATCPWENANYGIADNAAGQAYYDSMLKRYAQWGLDFIKVDCISDHPYRLTEIRQIADAIRKTKRPIVLSLSPGPTNLEHADEVARYAEMWRITNDHWDAWFFKNHTDDGFPFGLGDEFDRIAEWNKYVKPGSWPDPDMLPEGYLGPHAGWGEPRQSRYTQDEQRTEFTLWAISRSPMIFGGNLTKLDAFTGAMMTNEEVTQIDQDASESGPAIMPIDDGKPLPWRAWYAKVGSKSYAAVFNLGDDSRAIDVPWLSFHVTDKQHAAYDVWNKRKVPQAKALHVVLAPHACALWRID